MLISSVHNCRERLLHSGQRRSICGGKNRGKVVIGMSNPWKQVGLEEARAYDKRKESGRYSYLVAVKRRMIWNLLKRYLPSNTSEKILDLGSGGAFHFPMAHALSH